MKAERLRIFGEVDLHWDNQLAVWVTDAPINVRWGPFDFTVPAGFHTDLASIPRWALSFIPQVGRQNRAAVVHDWAWRGNVPGMSKATSNRMFLDIMRHDGVGWLRRRIMFRAVQLNAAFTRHNTEAPDA